MHNETQRQYREHRRQLTMAAILILTAGFSLFITVHHSQDAVMQHIAKILK
jgi:hypothetical protein